VPQDVLERVLKRGTAWPLLPWRSTNEFPSVPSTD